MTEHTTSRSVGIWIDHREAVLIFVSELDGSLLRIMSNVEERTRSRVLPSNAPHESQLVHADDSRGRRTMGFLTHYYDEVIARLAGATEVFIFGPGEAKGEFRKRFDHTAHPGCTVSIEPAARMSEAQLVQKVRKHFGLTVAPVNPIRHDAAREQRR